MWTLSGFADEIGPDPAEQCRQLRELGIGYLELRSAWGVNVLDLTDDQVEHLHAALARDGIRVSSIGSPIGKINIAEDFDAHLVRMDRAVQLAHRFEAPFIRVFSFFLDSGQAPADHRDEVLRRMRELPQRGADGGVVLLHENEKHIYGDVPERVLDIVESVGLPSLRLAWDAANYVQVGVRPFRDAYRMLRPYTDYIQIKDALLADGTVVPAGEGDGELPDTIRALVADGFDGFFSMEPHLAATDRFGGFSGAPEFARATRAFTDLLDVEGIRYR
ncbi:sugar phosphate isomerase/epimerase family protein [Pseudonocardia spinosispora]|uniref:sugar phosphate isomerase/epimerase family protein n=1 Tax=Pseudonocardia spinosispora TaxID=103441 RepID=UPI00040A89E7|nr:sugar phosphate isomerase/epimerase family protein [Pseudonocardia spinosispora]